MHKVDNDNNQEEVIWAMSNLETRDWDPGRVLVESDGEKEYQVCFIHDQSNNQNMHVVCFQCFKINIFSI